VINDRQRETALGTFGTDASVHGWHPHAALDLFSPGYESPSAALGRRSIQ
jgi:hypothetical protein